MEGVGRARLPGVKMHKLESTDAFIAFDLDDAAPAVGVVRQAPKILADGAVLLARSSTYQFATFERQVGGASAGINAKADVRAEAVTAFVDEVSPLVEQGTFLVQPGKGVDTSELAPLRAVDARADLFWEHGDSLRGLSAAVAADTASGGLDGRTAAIEGFDASGPALLRALAERGAKVVAISTAKGTLTVAQGLEVDALVGAFEAHGPAMVAELAGEPADPAAVFAQPADVLFAGSKAGVIDHDLAAGLEVRTVVPAGAVPVTAKALAELRRNGTVVVPDFVSTAGPTFAMWPDDGATIETVRAAAIVGVIAVMGEVLDHDDGPLLAACYRAEAFLSTWQDSLPFGRPLA
jgi:glutamate dehydrogenase/leucine dehydrogenase